MTAELAAQIAGHANTFVKADARIEGNCRRTISYLQGYCCPKLQLQETEQSETYGV